MILKDFYSVEESNHNSEGYSTLIKINKNHNIYEGHFPGLPVTPGVILMQLFLEEAQRITSLTLQLQQASNVKFMAVVDPSQDENFILHTNLTKKSNTVSIKGTAQHKGCTVLKINAVYIIKN